MNKRRAAMQAMMAPIEPPTADEISRPVSRSGSVKAMGLSLQSLSADADEARDLRQQLASGDRVVELDAGLIEPSFIRDRLPDTRTHDFEALRASIAEHGQQVPILVRPHSEHEGRYQVAYGHRRLDALKQLGRPVKAIVRSMTDVELVIAQGKENLERRDLSFIESALFAARLEDRGFSRLALIAALSVHKGNLSTMISVVRAIPEDLIVAIGPAPKIGRPRWEQLSALLRSSNQHWHVLVGTDEFLVLDSDTRFERVFRALTPATSKPISQIVPDPEGKPIAHVARSKTGLKLTIDGRAGSDFGAYLIERLPEIHAEFRRNSKA